MDHSQAALRIFAWQARTPDELKSQTATDNVLKLRK